MPACAPMDAIAQATESLPIEIYNKLQAKSIWFSVPPRTKFRQNMGLVQTVYETGKLEPDDSDIPWQAESDTTEGNIQGACSTPDNEVQWGFDQWTYSPEKTQFHGPILCKDAFTYEWEPDTFLTRYVEKLTLYSERIWEYRIQEHYLSLTPKYIAGAGNGLHEGQTLPPGQTLATLPSTVATSQLTQPMLDTLAGILNAQGVANQEDPTQEGFFSLAPKGTLYKLYIGQEMSNILLANNPTLVKDLQFADMGKGDDSRTLTPLGAEYKLKNFMHVINLLPPRYNWDGENYVRVPVYIQVAGTGGPSAGSPGGGLVSVINPAWVDAAYEAAFILNPLVMEHQPILPQVNAGGVPFDPINYFGEWQFVQGAYRLGLDCVDPLDRFGRHYAVFKHAMKPVFPSFGISIIFKRCIGVPFTVGCS